MQILKNEKTCRSDHVFEKIRLETAALNARYAERGENKISADLKLTIDTDNVWDKFLRVRRRDESS